MNLIQSMISRNKPSEHAPHDKPIALEEKSRSLSEASMSPAVAAFFENYYKEFMIKTIVPDPDSDDADPGLQHEELDTQW